MSERKEAREGIYGEGGELDASIASKKKRKKHLCRSNMAPKSPEGELICRQI